jgi:hypothetical protein
MVFARCYAVAQDAGEARSRDRIRNEREVVSSREIVPMSEFRRSPLDAMANRAKYSELLKPYD